jgi:hypothetical protein
VEKLLEEPKFEVVVLSRSVCLFSTFTWQSTESVIY